MANKTLASQIKILVISIKGQDDRRSYISKTLNNLGLNWEFIDAVIGKNLKHYPAEYDVKKRLKHFGFHISNGLLGCFLSHRKAWQKCIELNQICIILEDDAKLMPHFTQAIDIAIQIQDHWDLFRLNAVYEKDHLKIGAIDHYQIIENLKDPSSAAGFIVKPSAARKLLMHSEHFYIPNDDFIESRHIHGLRILALKPDPVSIAHELPSTIQDRFKPKLPLIKRIQKELYKMKNGWARAYWRLQRRISYKKLYF